MQEDEREPPSLRGAIARYYELYHREPRTFVEADEVRALLDRYLQPGVRCVDIGCGEGEPVGVRARLRGSRYVGVDIAAAAVRKAKAKNLDVCQIADASSLPFADDTFEVAFCLEVIEHLFDPESALREAQRVIVPYGSLIVTTPNVAYWRRRLDLGLLGRWNPLGYGKAVEEPWADPHIRFFNPGSLRRLLAKTGYQVEHLGGHGGSIAGDLPWLGHALFPYGARASPPYRRLEELAPSLFGCFLHAVGVKPARERTGSAA
jgi:SAM-dependent methyltransferase